MNRNLKAGLAIGGAAAVLLAASPLPHWNHYYGGRAMEVMQLENWMWIIALIGVVVASVVGWLALSRVFSVIDSRRSEVTSIPHGGGVTKPPERWGRLNHRPNR